MKNFLLADSSELMVVRLISASWAKKRLIPTFLTWCTSSWWKIFLSLIRANFWLLDSFRPPEPKNVWFLLSGQDVRRVHEKFSSRRFERADGCLTHFGLQSPKTFDSYFLDMMYVELMKNYLLAYSGELMVVRLISASWDKKRFIPIFLTWCTSSWWKIFFSGIRANFWLLDSFRPPEPKNVWLIHSGQGVRRVHEKFSSRRFERADGC